jgi:hypothetical protein
MFYKIKHLQQSTKTQQNQLHQRQNESKTYNEKGTFVSNQSNFKIFIIIFNFHLTIISLFFYLLFVSFMLSFFSILLVLKELNPWHLANPQTNLKK